MKNPSSLGAGFLGHDIKAVIAAFEKAQPGPKSEFETTEHYEARVASFKMQQPQYVFVNDPTTDVHPVDGYNDAGEFKYDADMRAWTRTVKISSSGEGRFVLRTVTSTAGQYVGTNAFGARTVVNRFEKDVYALRLADKSSFFQTTNLCSDVPGCYVDGDWTIKIKFPMEAAEAQGMKGSLRMALLCTVTGAEIIKDDQITKATISSPQEIQWRDRGLPVSVDKIWLFDNRSGRILDTIGY